MKSSSEWGKDLRGSLVAKVSTAVPSALIVLVATRLLVGEFGLESFATYALLLSIPVLLPFADFGIGGTVTQLVAQSGEELVSTRVVLRRAVVVLSLIGTTFVFVSFGLWISDFWERVLNESDRQNVLSITVALFGISLPTVLGYRVLLGLQLNRIVTALQGSSSIVGGLGTISVCLLGGPFWAASLSPVIAGLFVSSVGCVTARKKFRERVSSYPSRERIASKPVKLLSTAWPLMVIAVSAPIMYQIDRSVLAANVGTFAVAAYGAAFQIYGPLNSMLVAAGQTLWPRFAAMGASGSASSSVAALTKSVAVFAGVGAIAGAFVAALGPLIVRLSTGGAVADPRGLCAAFALLLFVSATNYPIGMFMISDGRLLRYQAGLVAAAAVLKLVFAHHFADWLGASGPLLATCSVVAGVVLLPSAGLIWRGLQARELSARYDR